MAKKNFVCLLIGMLMLSAAFVSAQTNVALSATPSTSYCSSWETIDALNDGYDPTDSNDESHPQYGNWPETGTQWVQYDWGSAQTIDSMAVYWFDDPYGIDCPSAARLYNWNGSSFVQIATVGTAVDQYNNASFSTISTTRIRLEFDSNGSQSTGILEWQVYEDSGATTAPPTTPPPTTPPPTTPPPTTPPPTGGEYNIAPDATASTSYVSSWETLSAINDEVEPNDSSGTNPSGIDRYGNWNQTGTQWVEYQWASSVQIHKSAVYWFDDNQGIDLPSAGRLLYWNGSSYINFASVGTADDQYNVNTFSQITTTRIRLEMDSNGTYSTGVLEWQVYSGDPPPTTPPPTTPPPTTPPPVTPTPGPGNLVVQPFDLSQVSLSSSRLTENMNRTLSYLTYLDSDRMLYNFRAASGLSTEGASAPGGWDAPDCKLRGHSTGHFLKALAQAYAQTGNTSYRTKANYLVTELGECQDAFYDNSIAAYGFLSAYDETQFDQLEDLVTYPTIWAPYYTLHKIFSGLIAAYELCGNSDALDIASDLGVWVYNRLSQVSASRLQQMWALYIAGEFGGMNDSLAHLYEITGDSRHLTAAQYFDNDSFFNSLSNNQDVLSGKHANQHIPQITGALRIYDSTEDNWYYNAARNFWYMVTEHHMYNIGGTSEGEMWDGADQIEANITNNTCETCCAYNMLKLSRRLFFHDPRPEYMDYYERALYNQILASQNPSSSHGFVTYMVPLGPGGQKSYSSDYSTFTCCHGTGMENHTKYGDTIYARSNDNSTLYVNLFIPSTLNWSGNGFEIVQSTDYPEGEDTTITVNGSGALDIKIRVPSWAKEGYDVRINDQLQSITATPGTYITLSRTWSYGDEITIDMPFSLWLETTPDDSDTGSILYGPIVEVGDSTSTSWQTLNLNLSDLSQSITPTGTPLYFNTNGMGLRPMYEAHNMRYHAYFRIN